MIIKWPEIVLRKIIKYIKDEWKEINEVLEKGKQIDRYINMDWTNKTDESIIKSAVMREYIKKRGIKVKNEIMIGYNVYKKNKMKERKIMYIEIKKVDMEVIGGKLIMDEYKLRITNGEMMINDKKGNKRIPHKYQAQEFEYKCKMIKDGRNDEYIEQYIEKYMHGWKKEWLNQRIRYFYNRI